MQCFPNETGELQHVVEFVVYNTPGPHGLTPRDIDRRWSLATPLEKELQPFRILQFEPITEYCTKLFATYREIRVRCLAYLRDTAEKRAELANRARKHKTIKPGMRVMLRDPRHRKSGGRGPYEEPFSDPCLALKSSPMQHNEVKERCGFRCHFWYVSENFIGPCQRTCRRARRHRGPCSCLSSHADREEALSLVVPTHGHDHKSSPLISKASMLKGIHGEDIAVPTNAPQDGDTCTVCHYAFGQQPVCCQYCGSQNADHHPQCCREKPAPPPMPTRPPPIRPVEWHADGGLGYGELTLRVYEAGYSVVEWHPGFDLHSRSQASCSCIAPPLRCSF